MRQDQVHIHMIGIISVYHYNVITKESIKNFITRPKVSILSKYKHLKLAMDFHLHMQMTSRHMPRTPRSLLDNYLV